MNLVGFCDLCNSVLLMTQYNKLLFLIYKRTQICHQTLYNKDGILIDCEIDCGIDCGIVVCAFQLVTRFCEETV